ncbi:MAG TPA: hypothetical protein DCY42_02555 [Chloroflexi bacterium]|nr:hypothetical protein [Chloroflexota bacterium]
MEQIPASQETQTAGNTAMILEIVFGLFGQLGIGHVYTGRLGLGIGLLLGWWIYIAVATTITTATVGFAGCIFVPIGIIVPIISGLQAKKHMLEKGGDGDWGKVAIVGIGGCLTFIILSAIVIFVIFGGLAAFWSSFNY